LAGETAAPRWGPEAGEDFLIAQDGDSRAAVAEFPRFPALLLAQPTAR
jgi:hypothetical protein